eukprot:7049128-Prymnesium_polylepis.1
MVLFNTKSAMRGKTDDEGQHSARARVVGPNRFTAVPRPKALKSVVCGGAVARSKSTNDVSPITRSKRRYATQGRKQVRCGPHPRRCERSVR